MEHIRSATYRPFLRQTINARGGVVSLAEPVVMGILNITPDSFHLKSRIESVDQAIAIAGQMLEEGAAILDVGAASSRPGAEVIPAGQELDRLMPVLEALLRIFPEAVVSVDTWRELVARSALDAGAHLINDITAGTMEPGILNAVADAGGAYIAMHMQGSPGQMPSQPQYEDVMGDILSFFVDRIAACRAAGIKDLILDPGFGFGKTRTQNFQLLQKLSVLRFLELPLLIGLSRKSTIWKTLHITPAEALNGTTALHMVALLEGANMLRVHDVREAMETIRLFQELRKAGQE